MKETQQCFSLNPPPLHSEQVTKHRRLLIALFPILCILALATPGTKAYGATTSEGWFTIIWGDGRPGSELKKHAYTLTEASGTSYLLDIQEGLAQPYGGIFELNNTYISVQGIVKQTRGAGNGLPVLEVSALTPLQAPQSMMKDSEMADLPAVSGSKPWVSIMCKFSDISTEPKNLSYFQGMYANSYPGLDHYWRELSYNTVNIAGSNAYGWFTLPQPESYYNKTGEQDDANLNTLFTDCIGAADPTVDFSSYSGINMMFNSDFDRGLAWGGSRYTTIDDVTKSWSVTWEPPWGYATVAVIAHEMGHGFGLPHSSGMYGYTYDNEWDIMSDSWSNCDNSRDTTYGCLGQHTISYHKDRLGWIPADQRYVTAGANITLTIDHLALNPTTNYRMVKIPVSGSTYYYTVEVRKKSGYDVKLPGKGVIIHEVDTTRDERPAQVVDEDGDGTTGDEGAMWIAGETYTDPGNTFSVTVLSETANGYQISITFPVSVTGPDLIVQSPGLNETSVNSDDPVTVSAVVKNQGNDQSSATTLRYYISTDSTITTGDSALGTDSISLLNSNETSAQSDNFSAPSQAGAYYLGACVDTVSNELSTTNNCSAGVRLTVTTTNPDLVVQSPSVSSTTPEPGESITLSSTVRNQGDGDSDPTTLVYYRSTNSIISTSDTQIGTDAISALSQNGTSPESFTFNAPETPGTYYYGSCVNSVTGESNTTNNCSTSASITVVPPGEPDLIVETPSINDITPLTGQTLVISAAVRNQGNLQADSTVLTYYRSTNATISSSDTEIGNDTVSSLGQDAVSSESLSFTAPSSPGTYYYGGCVTPVSDESVTSNNCSSGVKVSVSDSGEPDLIVETLSISDQSPSPDQPVTLYAVVKNRGSLQSGSSSSLTYYISADDVISASDIAIGTDTVAPLAAASASSHNLTTTAPSEKGTYYFGACVQSVHGETQTTNNCSSGTLMTVDSLFPWNMFLPTITGAGR